MATNHGHGKPEPLPQELIDLGYENRDIDPKGIGKATVAFFLFTIFCFGIVLAWFLLFEKDGLTWARDSRKPQLASPKYPLVQSNTTTKVDIMDLRQAETKALTDPASYVDESQTYVRLPIDQAISLYLKKNETGGGEPEIAVPAKTTGNTIEQNALPPTEVRQSTQN